ncbi:MAG TPA: DUF309 domain-containing protein [Gemmatimonadota bacterium]|nr:DUF309 domain-containing protein [Gemmatimonadota bacterium]
MALREPRAPRPSWPRYTGIPFPPYRFVPGLNARPAGEIAAPRAFTFPERWSPEEWRSLTAYLYGIDLYNFAYWWECHEVLEGLWHTAGRTTPPARFVQAIIHLAASNLNRHRSHGAAAERQTAQALGRLEAQAERTYMGIDVDDLTRRVRASSTSVPWTPPLIRLDYTNTS